MGPTEREPCASCAELIAVDARLCPYCGRSALVDLRLPGPVTDGRVRYQAARALAGLGGNFPPVVKSQRAMEEAQPRLARALTRSQAHRAHALLAPLGLESYVQPAPFDAGAGLMNRAAVTVGVVLALCLAGWAALRSRAPVPAATPPAATAGAVPGAVVVPAGAPEPRELSRNELARLALASTASLRCGNSIGAGFFVAEGLLLTNAHVLCRQGTLRVVLADGRETSGVPLRTDEELDLALVSAGGLGVPALALGDAAALTVGDKVLMAGSPVGMDFTVHEGMVSAVGRVVLGTSYIQLDAKVNPGNSGGPVLDARGRAVGIVSLKRTDAEGIALALPINYAYAGSNPFVAAPAARSTAFDSMIAKAREEEAAQAGHLATVELKPALAGVSVDANRQVLVHVVRPARNPPAYEEFAFKVWRGSSEVCALTTSVNQWKPVEAPEAASKSGGRLQAWLNKHGLSAQLYLGEAPLRLDLCARDQMVPGVQLELQGADPSHARLILQ
jgi:serine protease Do